MWWLGHSGMVNGPGSRYQAPGIRDYRDEKLSVNSRYWLYERV